MSVRNITASTVIVWQKSGSKIVLLSSIVFPSVCYSSNVYSGTSVYLKILVKLFVF